MPAVLCKHLLQLNASEFFLLFHLPERHRQGNGATRVIADETGKLGRPPPLSHILQEFRLAVHLLGKDPSILGRYAPDQFDRRTRQDRGAQLLVKLVKVLVSNNEPDLVFARLVKKTLYAFIKIVLCLINIHERASAQVLRDRRPLLRRLGKKGDKKPTQNFTAILLQQILGGVDENKTSPIHGFEEIQPVFFIAEHPLQHRVCQNAPEAREDLLAGVVGHQ